MPVLSRLQAEGARYWDFVRVGQVGLGYTIVVVLAFVIGAAVPVTALLLGPRWAEAAPVLSLLAVAAVFQTLNSASYWVYISKGITGPLFRYNLVSVSIKIACILIGSQWGIIGVAVGYAIAPTLSWPISLLWISRVIDGVPTRTLAWGIVRMALLAGWGARGLGAAALTEPLGLGSRCPRRRSRRSPRTPPPRCSPSCAATSSSFARCCACCDGNAARTATPDGQGRPGRHECRPAARTSGIGRRSPGLGAARRGLRSLHQGRDQVRDRVPVPLGGEPERGHPGRCLRLGTLLGPVRDDVAQASAFADASPGSTRCTPGSPASPEQAARLAEIGGLASAARRRCCRAPRPGTGSPRSRRVEFGPQSRPRNRSGTRGRGRRPPGGVRRRTSRTLEGLADEVHLTSTPSSTSSAAAAMTRSVPFLGDSRPR